jgi:DNA-binding LacI/PurR family transcriptional regulator
MAARMILQMAQGQPPQEHVVFPFQIHVRASSVRG